jgi:serine-type D-Ala-D-Ala carboxypeptidase/endopeptidase
MRLLSKCIGAFVVLALSTDVNAQTPAPDTMVDHAAAAFVKDGPWIGLSVAVVQDNKIRIHNYGTTRTDQHNVKPDTVPGLIPRHSNTAGALLAILLENIYHQPYDQLLSGFLTGTLNMKHTYLNLPLDKAALLAKCYNDKGMPQPYIVANQSAAWSVKSTIGDMANYMAYQLDEGNAAVKFTPAGMGRPGQFRDWLQLDPGFFRRESRR